MTVNSQRHSVLLDNVYSLIDKKVDAQQKSLVQQFGRLLYKNISNDDLENRNDSDLYGATLSLWSGLAKFKSTAPYIRVFNPEIEKHISENPSAIEFARENVVMRQGDRYGAVSSFGFGGTNAHVILKSVEGTIEAPVTPDLYNPVVFPEPWNSASHPHFNDGNYNLYLIGASASSARATSARANASSSSL